MALDFSRLLGKLIDLPGVEQKVPSTVQDVLPLVGDVVQVTIQLVRENEFDTEGRVTGARFTAFLSSVEDGPDGNPIARRMVLPDKAVRRLVAQWNSLHDRKRPAARMRRQEFEALRQRGGSFDDEGDFAAADIEPLALAGPSNQ